MLSRMLSTSWAGMTRRIEFSMKSASRAVSSMRVPVLARTWRINWPLVSVGKEVLAQPRREGPGGKTEQKKHRDKYEPAMNQGRKQALVGVAKTLEAALERILKPNERIARSSSSMMIFRFEQVERQGRHERSGQEIRREHGEHHRLGQRHEQITGDAAQKEQWQEHDADAQG